MMVIAISASFVACDSDDDDDDGIVGTWSGHDRDDYEDVSLTVTFKKDGSGTWVEEVSRYNYNVSWTDRGTLTYEMEGSSKGFINVRINNPYSGNGRWTYLFKIKGRKMYLYDDDYGYEDESVWVLTKQ